MRRTIEAIPLLLQLSERVIAVDHDLTVLDTWYKNEHLRPGSAMQPADDEDISDSFFIKYCQDNINDVFISGVPAQVPCIFFNGVDLVHFCVHIIWDSPARVLLVVQRPGRAESQQLENKWRLALDAAGDGMWDIDMTSQTISFSDKWHEMFGYAAHEIMTVKDWAAILHPDDIGMAERSAADYQKGRADGYSVELRYLCKSGEYKWILSRGVVISRSADGEPLRFIGTHQDIDARKREEEELRTTRDMFASSFNYSGAGKALLAPGGKWLAVNDAICDWTGYTKEELEGLHYRDITHHEDVDLDMQYLPKLLSGEIPAYTIEKRYVSKSRKIIFTLLTVTIVWDKPGVPKFFICDIVNITSQKELLSQVARNRDDMGTATANLENRIKQLEELNYIIAHNLRGPVNNITFLTENRDIFGDSGTLDMVRESSTRLHAELEQLLHMATIKLDTGIPKEKCDIAGIVNEIKAQLEGILFEKNIALTMELEVADVVYPKIYIESIIYNLVSNAIKYSDPEKDNQCIKITTRIENGRTVLAAKDNGIGIDMERHGNDVFKLNKVFHKGYDSKGVGLFITKTQVESMGGSISVKSKAGEGAEFIVVL